MPQTQFCLIKVNFLSQNSVLCQKIQICPTEFNSVSQKSIFASKFDFYTEVDSLLQFNFVSLNSVSHRFQILFFKNQ